MTGGPGSGGSKGTWEGMKPSYGFRGRGGVSPGAVQSLDMFKFPTSESETRIRECCCDRRARAYSNAASTKDASPRNEAMEMTAITVAEGFDIRTLASFGRVTMYGVVEAGSGELTGEGVKVGGNVIGESAVNARDCEPAQPGLLPLSCTCPKYVPGPVLCRVMKGVVSAYRAEVVLADNDEVEAGRRELERDVALGKDATVTDNVGLSTGSITTQHGSQTSASSPNS